MWHSSTHGVVHGGGTRRVSSISAEDSAFPAGYDLCAPIWAATFRRRFYRPWRRLVRVIGDAVGSYQVLLALIGDRWLDITDGTGHRRLGG